MLECAQLLIEYGAKPHAVTIDMQGARNEGIDPLEFFFDDETCLDVACRTAQPELVRLLLNPAHNFNDVPGTQLGWLPAKNGSLPLHHLCNATHGLHRKSPPCGAEQCLQILLSVAKFMKLTNHRDSPLRAPVDSRDGLGNTPLHLACRSAVRPGLVDALLKAGASVNAVNPDGETPLHLALVTLCDEARQVVRLLLDAGSDVLFKDSGGRTPLEAAISLQAHGDAIQGGVMVYLLREPTARAKVTLTLALALALALALTLALTLAQP